MNSLGRTGRLIPLHSSNAGALSSRLWPCIVLNLQALSLYLLSSLLTGIRLWHLIPLWILDSAMDHHSPVAPAVAAVPAEHAAYTLSYMYQFYAQARDAFVGQMGEIMRSFHAMGQHQAQASAMQVCT